MVPQRIVDAHHHLWELSVNSYPWLMQSGPHPMFGTEYGLLKQDYTVADFLADIDGLPVLRSVHLQADHDPADPVRESRWLAEVATRPPSKGFPHAIVGYADFFDPQVEDVLAGHAAVPAVKGIRQTLHHRKGEPLTNRTWLDNFTRLKKYGFSFDLQVYPRQKGPALELVDRNPDLQFILPHAGLPQDRSAGGIAEWRAALHEFAERPNVVCKLTGFGMLNRQWQIDDIRPIVADLIAIFGPRRLMIGSNFPVDRLGGTYSKTWHALFELTKSLSASECDDLYWGTAVRIYRIGV